MMEKVWFKNRRGRRLCGILHEPARGRRSARQKDNGRAVIMLHGFSGDKSGGGMFEVIASAIGKAGFSVLRFDFSGSGESNDEAICVKSQVEDARAALGFMKERGYTRFGLLGFSLGGLVALRLRDNSIMSRVLLAPLTSSINFSHNYSLWDQLMLLATGKRRLVKPNRKWRQEMFVARRFFFEVRSIDQKKLGRGISEPVLIIHGDRDNTVPLGFSKSMILLLGKDSRLKIIRGADHHFDDDVPRLSKLSSEWFSRNVR